LTTNTQIQDEVDGVAADDETVGIREVDEKR
jgi:hypothetical protein